MAPQKENSTTPRKRGTAENDGEASPKPRKKGNEKKEEENSTKSRKKDKPSRKPKSPKKKEGRKKAPRKRGETGFEKAWKETRNFLLYQFRQHYVLIFAVASVAMLLIALYFASDPLDSQRTPPVTDKVTLKLAINGTDIGSVRLGLFGTICPLTTKNFVMLATHEKGYGYKKSTIHTVIPMHMLIGGDITHGNGNGGRSALDTPFENENFQIQHSGPGYLGMLTLDNNRDSRRTSIFYITINAMPRLDKNSVVFGKVLNGMEVIKRIEATDMDDNFRPYGNVTISDISHEAA